MKGIVLAGGLGSRLYPITLSTSKQLLSVYDKPLIYYPLSILFLAGIKDILIICTEKDLNSYKNLLGDGSRFGVKFSYIIQKKPEGLPQAFTLGEKFIGNDNVCLVLGDNIFYSDNLINSLEQSKKMTSQNKCVVYGYYVNNPESFGVIEYDGINEDVLSLEEKPKKPKSNYAAIGLYFFPNSVIKYSKEISKSSRGEYEIISVLNKYLDNKQLKSVKCGRGFSWFDSGTPDSLLEAANFISILENNIGKKIACLEEISVYKRFISHSLMLKKNKKYVNKEYFNYLKKLK